MENSTHAIHAYAYSEHNGADRVPARSSWPPVWLAADCPEPPAEPVVPVVETPAAVPQVAIAASPKPTAAPAVLVLDESVDCPSWEDLPDDQLSTVLSCQPINPLHCKCGFDRFVDTSIHDDQTTRRDCARCGHTRGFPVWHGDIDHQDDVPVVTAADAAICRRGYTASASFATSKWHARQARRLAQQDFQQDNEA